MRKPRIARTDADAFKLVQGRLEADVGGLVALWGSARSQGQAADLTPFWAFARMLFPIAESIGDLIYRNDNGTVKNLLSVLQNEFNRVRPGYDGKANIIALMYRHSLTHTDEMRALYCPRTTITWRLSLGEQTDHLKVRKTDRGRSELQFDLTAFYEDIRQVCLNARRGKWGRKVAQRYNGWLRLNLNIKKKTYQQPGSLIHSFPPETLNLAGRFPSTAQLCPCRGALRDSNRARRLPHFPYRSCFAFSRCTSCGSHCMLLGSSRPPLLKGTTWSTSQ